MRLDRLRETLHGTLNEVVIAFSGAGDDTRKQAYLANIADEMRSQMPNMARQQRLVFRKSRRPLPKFSDDDKAYHTILQDVFTHDSEHWFDITFDD